MNNPFYQYIIGASIVMLFTVILWGIINMLIVPVLRLHSFSWLEVVGMVAISGIIVLAYKTYNDSNE